MKNKILFNAKDWKRLNFLKLKSPYANTQWLIQKIHQLISEIYRLRKELNRLDS